MTSYAYVRVSTSDKGQTTENQIRHIERSGFIVDEVVTEDGVSGTIPALERPAFSTMMKQLKEGDIICCTMLDRLGRNALDILTTIDIFKRMKVRVRVMQLDGIDITSPTGKLVVGVLASLAEIERDTISERTKQGMARTRDAGTKFGQPLKITPDVLEVAFRERRMGVALDDICAKYSINKRTLQRNLDKWGSNLEAYREEYYAREAQYSLTNIKNNSKEHANMDSLST